MAGGETTLAHDVLIWSHAAAGVISFAAGIVSLRLRSVASWWFRGYLAALVALVVFMVAVVAVDWLDLDLASRLVYTGLIVLGGYMLWRAWQAQLELRVQSSRWRTKYLDHVGFTLISLFDGFVIVGAIDLHLPGWLVAVIAVAGVVVGIATIGRLKKRWIPEPRPA